ncbi:MAG TPA: hypothetical protein VNJ51_10145 [Candidatus Dormibacteraeota bacterium]|nr:hypothetical protein [Candidatus Dormibacteraeota bacterium]
MRVYTARITGKYDDVRALSKRSKLYHPHDYAYPQRYARRLYDADRVAGHLQYRFSGYVLKSVARIEVR